MCISSIKLFFLLFLGRLVNSVLIVREYNNLLVKDDR